MSDTPPLPGPLARLRLAWRVSVNAMTDDQRAGLMDDLKEVLTPDAVVLVVGRVDSDGNLSVDGTANRLWLESATADEVTALVAAITAALNRLAER